jgi:hypothetical protein
MYKVQISKVRTESEINEIFINSEGKSIKALNYEGGNRS